LTGKEELTRTEYLTRSLLQVLGFYSREDAGRVDYQSLQRLRYDVSMGQRLEVMRMSLACVSGFHILQTGAVQPLLEFAHCD